MEPLTKGGDKIRRHRKKHRSVMDCMAPGWGPGRAKRCGADALEQGGIGKV